MKPRVPGSLEAAILAAYEQVGGIKRASELLGRKGSALYSYADPADRKGMPIEVAAQLVAVGGVALAEYFAGLAGGTFRPEAHATRADELMKLAGEAARETGEAVAVALTAASDGDITPTEAAKVADEVDGAIRTLTHLRAAVKPGRRPA